VRALLSAILVSVAVVASAGLTAAMAPAAGLRPVVFGANTAGLEDETGLALDRLTAEAGRTPKLIMYYRDWDETRLHALITSQILGPILARGATPMITWLPRLGSGDLVHQPEYAPALIAAGARDAFVRKAAREAAAYGAPLFIRFAHEMNGAWSPWGAGVDGNTPAAYVAMWRHIVAIFREEGATNVRWVWSPNVYNRGAVLSTVSATAFRPYYPGSSWVDYVALDGYNWGDLTGQGWRSFSEIFKYSYDKLVGLSRKPAMIAETASTEVGGDKAAWIRQIPKVLRSQMPRVRAVIWFDRFKETNWDFASSSSSLRAVRAILRDPVLTGGVRRLLAAAR
jgi:beta-mannanase